MLRYAQQVFGVIRSICQTCRDLSRALLAVISEHLKMEREIYEAAFVRKDPIAAHDANVQAVALLRKSEEIRSRIEAHRLTDHEGETPEMVEG